MTPPTFDLAARLDAMAGHLFRAGSSHPLGAIDGHDIRLAAAEIRRLRGEVGRLKGVEERLRAEKVF